jgi:hypothetical protein
MMIVRLVQKLDWKVEASKGREEGSNPPEFSVK